MKPLYIILLLLLCSCSITKKAATRLEVKASVEQVKHDVEEKHQALSVDTTKTEIVEYSIEEPQQVSSGDKMTPIKKIHYKRITLAKGISTAVLDSIDNKFKANKESVEVKAQKKEIVKVKNSFDTYIILIIGLIVAVLAAISLIIVSRKN